MAAEHRETPVIGVIQARMGSTRLPGKMMLPLQGRPVIDHVVRRLSAAETVDSVVLATTDHCSDDILEHVATTAGADRVFRGSTDDALGRVHNSIRDSDAAYIVHMYGDCPLLSPLVVDSVVRTALRTGAEYISNFIDRTFPRGYDAHAFTPESLATAESTVNSPHQREHLAAYFLDRCDELDTVSVTSDDVFDNERFHDRSDVRLTLDEADDYYALVELFKSYGNYNSPDVETVIQRVDRLNIKEINNTVRQK